jgi:hypothetical protein
MKKKNEVLKKVKDDEQCIVLTLFDLLEQYCSDDSQVPL